MNEFDTPCLMVTIARDAAYNRDMLDKPVACGVPPSLTTPQAATWLAQELSAFDLRQSRPDQPIKSPSGRYIKSIGEVTQWRKNEVVTAAELAELLKTSVLEEPMYSEEDVLNQPFFRLDRIKRARTLWLDCMTRSPADALACQLRDDLAAARRSGPVAWAYGIKLTAAKPYYQPNGNMVYQAAGTANVVLDDGTHWIVRGKSDWTADRDQAVEWLPVKVEVNQKSSVEMTDDQSNNIMTSATPSKQKRRSWSLFG